MNDRRFDSELGEWVRKVDSKGTKRLASSVTQSGKKRSRVLRNLIVQSKEVSLDEFRIIGNELPFTEEDDECF